MKRSNYDRFGELYSSALREGRKLKVMDFDIETRRIGFHNGGRFNPDGSEPVIIAAAFEGQEPEFETLSETWSETDMVNLLMFFREAYERADVVTGHYIRKFDLPILNGALFEFGLPTLGPKLVVDTKTDLVNLQGLSKSQENLSALLELEESKFHMNDNWWRKVARLTPEGLALAQERVVKDVQQHQALRKQLALDGVLLPPSIWSPRK